MRIFEGLRSSRTISMMRRPDISASAIRRESAAGIAALPGSVMPSASAIEAIVDAVPITMQCPAERERHASISQNSSSLSRPGPALGPEAPVVGARADVLGPASGRAASARR